MTHIINFVILYDSSVKLTLHAWYNLKLNFLVYCKHLLKAKIQATGQARTDYDELRLRPLAIIAKPGLDKLLVYYYMFKSTDCVFCNNNDSR